MTGTEVFQFFSLKQLSQISGGTRKPKNPRNGFMLHFKRSEDLSLCLSIIKRAE